jgi:hypothetical protein
MATTRTSALNRTQRGELARRLQAADPDSTSCILMQRDRGRLTASIASRSVPDRDPDSVRRFECFTTDLHRLADWLVHCGVITVAMKSTAGRPPVTAKTRQWVVPDRALAHSFPESQRIRGALRADH